METKTLNTMEYLLEHCAGKCTFRACFLHYCKGLDKLVAELDNLAQSIEERSHDGIFRMPIDRVFTVQGHGTVVTGTMISGTLKVGDEVVVYPKMLSSRVRSIQVYGEPVEAAYAGQRTAVNLSNVKVEELDRGDVIAPKGALVPSRVLDVSSSC